MAFLVRQARRHLAYVKLTSHHVGDELRPVLLYQLGLPTGLALVTTQGCGDRASDEEASRTVVDAALDTLVAELVADRPADAAMYAERLQAYLVAHPAFPDGLPSITPLIARSEGPPEAN